jgi:hypothetical protein
MNRYSRCVLIAVLLYTMVACNAKATLTHFFARDDITHQLTNSSAKEAEFLASLDGTISKENFEGFNDGDESPLNLVFGTLSAPYATNHVYQEGVFEYQSVPPGDKVFVHNGDLTPIEITFNESQEGVGFYCGDIGDAGHYLTIEIIFQGGSTTTVMTSDSEVYGANLNGDQCWFYWGIISDEAITGIKFWGENDSEGFWLDDITVTPEPSTFLLLGLGGVLLRRRSAFAKATADKFR